MMQTKDQPGLEVFGPHSGLEPVQPGLEQHQQHQYRPFPDAQGHYPPTGSQFVEKQPHSSRHGNGNGNGNGTICGLRKPTFWLALALATVIVVAAAVGGGVGATQAGKSSSNSIAAVAAAATTGLSTTAAPNSLSPTATSAGAHTVTVTTIVQVATAKPTTDCPGSNGTVWTGPGTSISYIKYCGANLASQAYKQALVGANMPSFNLCISMCDSLNYFQNTKNATAAVFNLGGPGSEALGTCWCVQAIGWVLGSDASFDIAVQPS